MMRATAVVLGAGSIGVWFFDTDGDPEAATTDLPTFAVRRGDLPITLKVKGTFQAEEAIQVRCEVGGGPKITWLAAEGTHVKEGDKLVELDPTGVEKHIDNLEQSEERLQSELQAAEADLVIQELDDERQLRKAEMDLEMARLELKKFREIVMRKEVHDAEFRVRQAAVKARKLKAIDSQMPGLLKQGFVTKEEVEQSAIDVEAASNAEAAAKLDLTILRDYTHPMKQRELEGRVKQLETNLERHKKSAERRAARVKARLLWRRQDYKRHTQWLKEARERLEKMTIHAPSAGIVVWGDPKKRWWQEEIKVGATAHHRQVIMRLPNLDTMEIQVKIHEAYINKVRADEKNPQPALVTTDSIEDKTFQGYVKKVETVAQGDRFRENVRRFTTIIGLKEQIPNIRPGMTGSVEIFIKQLEGVLYVPVQCVRTRDGESYCYVLGPRGPEKRSVTAGDSSHNFAHIQSGLTEGEIILIAMPEAETETNGQSEPDEKAKRPERPGQSSGGAPSSRQGKRR
jgi:multidrug efflux pump subunit AcrA (membrane-fusion protein)